MSSSESRELAPIAPKIPFPNKVSVEAATEEIERQHSILDARCDMIIEALDTELTDKTMEVRDLFSRMLKDLQDISLMMQRITKETTLEDPSDASMYILKLYGLQDYADKVRQMYEIEFAKCSDRQTAGGDINISENVKSKRVVAPLKALQVEEDNANVK